MSTWREVESSQQTSSNIRKIFERLRRRQEGILFLIKCPPWQPVKSKDASLGISFLLNWCHLTNSLQIPLKWGSINMQISAKQISTTSLSWHRFITYWPCSGYQTTKLLYPAIQRCPSFQQKEWEQKSKIIIWPSHLNASLSWQRFFCAESSGGGRCVILVKVQGLSTPLSHGPGCQTTNMIWKSPKNMIQNILPHLATSSRAKFQKNPGVCPSFKQLDFASPHTLPLCILSLIYLSQSAILNHHPFCIPLRQI